MTPLICSETIRLACPRLRLERGQAGQSYQALGRGPLNLEALPVLFDQQGPFSNPSSDSERSGIREQTTRIGLVFFDFGGQPELEAAPQHTADLLRRWANARALNYGIQAP